MAGFLSPLELEYLDGVTWKITAPFTYHIGAPDGVESVQIPIGFVTDFASVPKVLWNLLPPVGTYGKAAVIHDWLYQDRVIDGPCLRVCTRAEADAILFEAMTVLAVGFLTRWTIYLGVRVGGWVPWSTYRRHEHESR
jgi:hypothetical protein